MPSDRDCDGRRRPAGHSHRLRFNSGTRGHAGSAAIEMQTQIMKSSLWAAFKSLELGTPTVARLGQPTEVAGEWRPPLPSTPTRCSGCRGSFPSRAPKEGSQRGAVTTLCTWRRSHAPACRAAQQEKPAELAGRANPQCAALQQLSSRIRLPRWRRRVRCSVVWHGWVPLGPTERPPGARQTRCFWALFQRSRANHSWDEPIGKRNSRRERRRNDHPDMNEKKQVVMCVMSACTTVR